MPATTPPTTEPAQRPVARRAFRSMGTDVLLALDLPPGETASAAFDDAERELARLVAIFNRFDPTSELRRLERDRAVVASPELIEVVELALAARRTSAGRFDPTVLPSLRALGYAESIEHVRGRMVGGEIRAHRPGAVSVSRELRAVALGTDVALDLGGIAKGWIVDRIAERLGATAPALVDAGGDVSCTERPDHPWTVAIDGLDDDTVIQLPVGGAIATSGIDRRRWRDPRGGTDRHHVVDPATGASADTDLVRVTVVAGSCAQAEVAATSMLVGGTGCLDELGHAFDVAWLAIPAEPGTPAIRSKELR